LRVLEFNVEEEEFESIRGVFVVLNEGRCNNGELVFEFRELELVFVVELDGVEEDHEREWARTGKDQDAAKEIVCEANEAAG